MVLELVNAYAHGKGARKDPVAKISLFTGVVVTKPTQGGHAADLYIRGGLPCEKMLSGNGGWGRIQE